MLAAALSAPAHAAEYPSFLQPGDVFCTDEGDFTGYVTRGGPRSNSGLETCRPITQPTRVAILGGRAGSKTMVRISSGPDSYSVGWTNGGLPGS